MALIVKIFGKDKLSGKLKKIGGNVLQLAKNFTKFGALAGGAIGAISIKLAADMEKGLREIGTLMGGLTDREMKNMGKELRSLAASSGQAMKSLTKARYDIVSAGFAEAADSAILLKTSADLAVGGVTEVSVAADLLTTTLNAYNMSASQTVGVSDKLFTIVRLGKTTMGELGGSMGNVLALAGQLNVNLDEVGAVLATLTAGGINTAESVTALNATMTQMLTPTEDLERVISDLGYVNGMTMIKSNGLAESIRLIQDHATKTKTPITDLFSNVRAMKAILPLTGTAAKTFATNLEEMGKSSGATAGAVSEMEKSFSLNLSKLKQNVNDILIEIGTALISILQPKIKQVNAILEELGDIGWDIVASVIVDNWVAIFDHLQSIMEAKTGMLKQSFLIAWNDMLASMPGWTKVFTGATQEAVDEANLIFKQNQKTWEVSLQIRLDAFKAYIESLKKAAAAAAVQIPLPEFDVDDLLLPDIDETAIDWGELNPPEIVEPDFDFTSDEDFAAWSEKMAAMHEQSGLTAEGIAQNFAASWQSSADNAAMFTNAVGALGEELLAGEKARIQSKLDADIQAVLDSGMSEEAKADKIQTLRDQAVLDEKKAAKKLKPIKYAQALSETALLVLKAMQTKPFFPVGLAMGALAAATGAAQIATIAAQPYATGGFVPGSGSGDTVPAMLTPGEFVMNKGAVASIGRASLEGMNAGGGRPNIILNVTAPLVDETILDSIIPAIEKAQRLCLA